MREHHAVCVGDDLAVVQMRQAGPGDVGAVLAVLDEACRWLAGRGVEQWPVAFSPEWIEPGLGAGQVWLAQRAGAVLGTITVQWDDPLWPDDGRAGYVHRLAVRRQAAGLGAGLLAWAAGVVREHGRDRLRLDCVAGNARLRAYYENSGYAHCGDVEIPVDAALSPGELPVVSRYELEL